MAKKNTTSKVTKTASSTKVLKTTNTPKQTPKTVSVRVKKVNKMVEIVNKAKANGFTAIVVGKHLKTMTCKNCNKQACLFTNEKITILACICGHRRLI